METPKLQMLMRQDENGKVHFTNEVYRKIEKFIRESPYNGDSKELIILEDENYLKGIRVECMRYISGEWTTGGSFDYGPKEMVWKVTKEEYIIEEFSCWDEYGDEVYLHDFSKERMEQLLNRK